MTKNPLACTWGAAGMGVGLVLAAPGVTPAIGATTFVVGTAVVAGGVEEPEQPATARVAATRTASVDE
ncbi:MAG: hypothetical protein ABW106_14680 [Steroidobacteraceae bacterium]